MSSFLQKPIDIENRKIEISNRFRFQCNMCGNCCRGRYNSNDNSGIFLSDPDLKRIAYVLQINIEDFISKYTTIIYDEQFNQNICKLRTNYSGSCSLLKKGRCIVYSGRPRTCALFPIVRAINFNQYKRRVEYVDTSYHMSNIVLDYECEFNTQATEVVLESWLSNNLIPIDDIADREWFQKLLEISNNLRNKKLNDGELKETFRILYLN